jgi:2-polyprenyl-3-methyl-5-hydroxy-6-metoxy-1,4-benzoquinol methylase
VKQVDVVVSNGTLEHLDDPAAALRHMGDLVPYGGELLISCPCFLNIRGLVWMTLQYLLDVPMSLTDLWFISPFDIEEWLGEGDLRLERTLSLDYSRGNGELMLRDLEKRLPNALRDAGLDGAQVQRLMDWLTKLVRYRIAHELCDLEGATMIYYIRKMNRKGT